MIERLRIGRRTYLILEQLGRGQRCRYLALDWNGASGGELRSFLSAPATCEALQNIRLLKRISNQNINLPQLLDFESTDGDLRIITTWVGGRDLRRHLNRDANSGKRRTSPTEAVRLLRGLAHGLGQLLRSFALIHGDIKPENLILARRPSRLVMIDYGSAWLLPRTRSRFQGDGISPAYAAPELQIDGCVPDARCDQFSASVVAYEMLTGRLPYDTLGGQAGRSEFRSRMSNKLVPPSMLPYEPSRLPRSLWKAIDDVVVKGLHFDPDHRFPTAASWIDELDSLFMLLKGHPRHSRNTGRMRRLIGRLHLSRWS